MATKPKRGFIRIHAELCKGCYLCQSVCPLDLISVSETLNQKGYYPAFYKEERLEIESRKCKGCALCVHYCPRDVLHLSEERNHKGYAVAAVHDAGDCTGCRLCEISCPDLAIYVAEGP